MPLRVCSEAVEPLPQPWHPTADVVPRGSKRRPCVTGMVGGTIPHRAGPGARWTEEPPSRNTERMSTPQDPNDPGRPNEPNQGWGAPQHEPWGDQPAANQGYENAPPPGQQWGPPPGQGGYGGPPAKKNGLGVASLILGIIGLVLSIFLVGALFGIVAVILGFIGRGNVKRGEADNGGQALAGIITGALSVVAAIVFGLIYFNVFGDYASCVADAETQAEVRACEQRFEEQYTE